MRAARFMLIAGESSGDTLAAELVHALREETVRFESAPTTDTQPLHSALNPKFFGAGGPAMAAAGVDLAVDMSAFSVFGLVDVIKKYRQFRALFHQLLRLAIERQPDVIICVDFSGFNRRLARAIKAHVKSRRGSFDDWSPRIVQYVSPQVWASRPGRADAMPDYYDLLLSIFPFEKAWYQQRVPGFDVQFVGHPMLDRFARFQKVISQKVIGRTPLVALLPGSRVKELKRHLPVVVEAARIMHASERAEFCMVVPNENLAAMAREAAADIPAIKIQIGNLAETLSRADLAIASSGTVTMECACFGVPTLVLYKLSDLEYEIARRIVKVNYIAMPNLLADQALFPEFIQHAAVPERMAATGLNILRDPARLTAIHKKLAEVVATLGGPGASRRAAQYIVSKFLR